MMADTTRYFPIPSNIPSYTNAVYVEVARKLAEQCWAHHEGIPGGADRAQYGSLYSGALGPCGYLRLRLASRAPSSSLRGSEGESNVRTERDAEHAEEDLLNDGMRACDAALRRGAARGPSDKPERCTLLGGRSTGALAIKCALSSLMGRSDDATAAARRLLRMGESCRSPVECLDPGECEVLCGRAGYLQALLFVRRCLLGDEDFGRTVVVNTIRTMIQTGIRTSGERGSSLPLLWEWHGKQYLGAAHGVAGILYTLLHFLPEMRDIDAQDGSDIIGTVRSAVERLDGLCFPTGNLRSSVGRETDKLVHWCHGSAGYVLLLVKAYEIFGEERYLRRAEKIARDVIYPRGLLRKGVGLCHGISGNAYAFLAVYRGRLAERRTKEGRAVAATPPDNLTEEDEWVKLARLFANFAIHNLENLRDVPDRPYSLYEGIGGLSALLLDLNEPREASFPCFGL